MQEGRGNRQRKGVLGGKVVDVCPERMTLESGVGTLNPSRGSALKSSVNSLFF